MKSHFSKSNEKEDISYLVRRVVPRQEAEAEEPGPELSRDQALGGGNRWEGSLQGWQVSGCAGGGLCGSRKTPNTYILLACAVCLLALISSTMFILLNYDNEDCSVYKDRPFACLYLPMVEPLANAYLSLIFLLYFITIVLSIHPHHQTWLY